MQVSAFLNMAFQSKLKFDLKPFFQSLFLNQRYIDSKAINVKAIENIEQRIQEQIQKAKEQREQYLNGM